MQTKLTPEFASTPEGQHAQSILRKCVHCGFCNATCPTYQLLGDELDGPRGRIYQIKLVLEGAEPTVDTQQHLDRCLTCRSCETTCPSGVKYSQLLEIGREIVEQKVPRSPKDRWMRRGLTTIVPNATLFSGLVNLGRWVKPLLPSALKQKIPSKKPITKEKVLPQQGAGERTMIMLKGCAQPSLAPNTNIAAKRLLARLGIHAIELDGEGCCGAVYSHTSAMQRGREAAMALIDLWHPYLEKGVEGFIMTASGCGVTVKDYPHLLRDIPDYAEKAQAISDRTFDLSEVIAANIEGQKADWTPPGKGQNVAFHAPCTLQHGQKIKGQVEHILRQAGYQICAVKNSHLCCGSAGTYSLLQPEIAEQLRDGKWQALNESKPDIICTANVGCQTWLEAAGPNSVCHWIELL